MVSALIVAGAIVASAAFLAWYFREPDEIRVRRQARTLVRAVEKRAEWDDTFVTEHIKRARVRIPLLSNFPKMDEDWIDVIIEEAVFDMEADYGCTKGTGIDFRSGAERARGDNERIDGDVVPIVGEWGDVDEIGADYSPYRDQSGYETGRENPTDSPPAVEA